MGLGRLVRPFSGEPSRIRMAVRRLAQLTVVAAQIAQVGTALARHADQRAPAPVSFRLATHQAPSRVPRSGAVSAAATA